MISATVDGLLINLNISKMVKNFKSLNIWKRSRKFVKKIYLATAGFPDSEKFNLISQLNRAAVSVPSNIAEGCGRGTERDLSRFLDYAVGSSCEIETQLFLAYDLDFLPEKDMEYLTDEIEQIRKMIVSYQGTLRR